MSADESGYTALVRAIDVLLRQPVGDVAELMPWSSPVLAFGDSTRCRVATVGINPSNREFVDNSGAELQRGSRRLQTLGSLDLHSWLEADAVHLHSIIASYQRYFLGNPYNRWFRKLDNVVQGAGSSFYNTDSPACHLDLVPYATAVKWSHIPRKSQLTLLEASADTLGLLVRESRIEQLILNGFSVVQAFREVGNANLSEVEQSEWTLKRESSRDVQGKGYVGYTNRIGNVNLGRELKVLGYNHNLQSSFGVTKSAVEAIRFWVGAHFAR